MQRLQPARRPFALLVAFACASELVACAAPEAELETHERVLELSADLVTPREVGSDDYLGISMVSILAQETADTETPYRHSAAGCIIDHYSRDGRIIAVDELCETSHRRLFVYTPNSETVARSFGDDNADDLVDAWHDTADDILVEDGDHDGVLDRMTVAATPADRVLLELFDDTWIPPSHFDEVTFEDTDFDHRFDAVTITAGRDADGVQTYWVER